MGKHATSNSSPPKKAPTPRPNKSGKRPHSFGRLNQLVRAAQRTGRRVVTDLPPLSRVHDSEVASTRTLRDRLGGIISRKSTPKKQPKNPAKSPVSKGSNSIRNKGRNKVK